MEGKDPAANEMAKIIKIKYLNPVKLDDDNFFTWEAQLMTMLRGHRLLKYIEEEVDQDDDLATQQD